MNNALTYTYADYLTFPEGERIEIIGGRIYNMATAPFDVILKNDNEDIKNSRNKVKFI